MNELISEIVAQMHALNRCGHQASAVYLGVKELDILSRQPVNFNHCTCDHCGMLPRQRVQGLVIYQVDAKFHVKVV